MQLYPNYFSISSQIIVNRAKELGFEATILNAEKNFFSLSRNNKTWYFKNLKSCKTSAIAFEISNDKDLTKIFLKDIGVSVVEGIVLDTVAELTAWNTFPAVIKPLSQSHGTDVFTNISSANELQEIGIKLLEKYDVVLIEEYIEGIDLRILCVAGVAKSAIIRIPPFVVGDAVSTIQQLVDRENQNSNRGDEYSKELSKILVDESAVRHLRSQGLSLDSVVNKGEKVFISTKGNTGIGGTYRQVFSELTEENKLFAEKVAKKLNPDGIVAVDVLCEAPDKDWDAQVWKVLECEIAPGLRSHDPSILDDWLESYQ